MKVLFTVFLALWSVFMSVEVSTAEDTTLTPTTLIKTLEILDANSQYDEDNTRIVVVFAGDNLTKRKVVIDKGVPDYFSGLRIITLPVPPEKESEAWSLISYEVRFSEEQPNLWRATKRPKLGRTKQHIWFVFKINIFVPTNELLQYIKDYQTKPLRVYEGDVGYKIFKVRRDIKAVPMEDFMQGAETLYVEIDIDITKIDGKELKTP